MPGLLPEIDPEGLLEYSVVYTDRSLNHMSQSFQTVMNDISVTLKKVYHANAVVVVPGSGTFGMEAVVRQFAAGNKCLVIRNGWFSFRWTQIFDKGQIPSKSIVLKARRTQEGHGVFRSGHFDQCTSKRLECFTLLCVGHAQYFGS
jgi:aspartate aminotransferase-like enzyme